MNTARPTLEIEKEYQRILSDTLSRQSPYPGAAWYAARRDSDRLIPGEYRFPPQYENMCVLECERDDAAWSENVNNLL